MGLAKKLPRVYSRFYQGDHSRLDVVGRLIWLDFFLFIIHLLIIKNEAVYCGCDERLITILPRYAISSRLQLICEFIGTLGNTM